jgi:hypothetical protein
MCCNALSGEILVLSVVWLTDQKSLPQRIGIRRAVEDVAVAQVGSVEELGI